MPTPHPMGQSATGGRPIVDVISDLVANGSIELSVAALEQIPKASQLLPFGTSVYIPSPAKQSLHSTIEIVGALHEAGLEAVPHIAARKVESRRELRDYLSRVVEEYGVHRVLIIGGDVKQAAGPYADSSALLHDDVLAEVGIHEIGIAGYPEGHPRIPPGVLNADFDEKLELASRLGLGIEVITQFSFAPTRIVEYCATLSHRAPEIPVYVGLAGPTQTAMLIRYARYCGVSASLRALTDLGVKAIKLMSHTDPDEQLTALAQYCAMRESCNVIGIHVFSFGGFERSAAWMRNKCRQRSS
ncbi:MAG: methylenetetrahydrofolate reductase [Proteobacteria bacterium]|nr:methylenetetrahydrofolate reductase [Pseudomonadota bacterium]